MQYNSNISLITALKGTGEQALALDKVLFESPLALDLPEGEPTGCHGFRALYHAHTQTIHLCN